MPRQNEAKGDKSATNAYKNQALSGWYNLCSIKGHYTVGEPYHAE